MTLSMTRLPKKLRTVIGDRGVMIQHGHKIVKALLKGLLQLDSDKIYVRAIQPTTTLLSGGMDQVMFCDIKSACVLGGYAEKKVNVSMPYNISKDRRYLAISPDSAFWDHWSVGVMILEILLGSDIVLAAQTKENLEKIVEDFGDYLEFKIMRLLNALLAFDGVHWIADFLDNTLVEEPELITEKIRAVDVALNEDPLCAHWQRRFVVAMREHEGELHTKYRVTPALIKRT